jgi:hypothetical protein
MIREFLVHPLLVALALAGAACGPDQAAQVPRSAPQAPAAEVAPTPAAPAPAAVLDPGAAEQVPSAQDRVTLKREPLAASGSAEARAAKRAEEHAVASAAKHSDHANASLVKEAPAPAKSTPVARERVKPAPAEPAPVATPTPPAAAPAPAPVAPTPAATKVVVPRTDHVHVEVPKGLQAWLDADTRMQPWVATVMRVADRCYAQVRESNAGAAGTISVAVTMHKDARPDADILALPPQLSGVVACGTGDLMRSGMPLFTGNEGERYTVHIVFQ